MTAAISSGLFYESASTFPALTPSCPTGNCTWDEYTTLGICAETQDISNLLTVTDFLTDTDSGDILGLPNGINSSSNGVLYTPMLLAVANSSFPSIAFNKSSIPASLTSYDTGKNFSVPVADFFVIGRPNTPQEGLQAHVSQPYAVEVAISFCVQTLTTETTNGQSSTDIIAENDLFQLIQGSGPANFTYTPPGQKETFIVTSQSADYITDYLTTMFHGAYTRAEDGNGENGYPTDAIRAFVNATATPPYDVLAIKQVVANLATSMSNAQVNVITLSIMC